MTTSPPPPVLIVTGPDSVVDDLRRLLEPAGILVQPAVEGGEAAAEPGGLVATARLAPPGAGARSPDPELSAWAHRSHHDLMTPLAVISGMAETLEAAWERLPEADRARLLGAIRNQANRATTMLDEVFAVARDLAGEADGSRSTGG